MQDTVTVIVTLAGLFFSLTCALLLEELLFGMFFRLMARRVSSFEFQVSSQRDQRASNRTPTLESRNLKLETDKGGVTCSH
jgi:hypothetical protein